MDNVELNELVAATLKQAEYTVAYLNDIVDKLNEKKNDGKDS